MDEVDPLDGDVPETIRVKAASTQVLHRLITEWSTDSAVLAESLRQIAAVPVTEPERHELEAFLHMTQARAAWRRADELRRGERYRRTPRVAGPDDGRRKVTKGTCPSCGSLVRLRLDGGVRAHDHGSGAARSPSQDALPGANRSRCEGSGRSPVA